MQTTASASTPSSHSRTARAARPITTPAPTVSVRRAANVCSAPPVSSIHRLARPMPLIRLCGDVAHAHTHAHSHAHSHSHACSHRLLACRAHTSAPVSDCLGCCGAAGPSAPAGCPATAENGSWAWGAQYCECVNPLATAKDCKTCESTFDVCSNGFCPSTGQCLFGSSCTCSARGVCLCYCSDVMWCAACGMALRVGAAGPQSPASCPTTPLNGTWAWGADACSCVDPGTTFTSCAECESLSCSTGWCSDSKTCMYGSSAPVSPGFCNPQDYITSSGDC